MSNNNSRGSQVAKYNSRNYDGSIAGRDSGDIRIAKLLSYVKKGQDVLDLGCGDGYMMTKIKKLGGNVDGAEISAPVTKTTRKLGFKVYNVDLESQWSKELTKKYDLVIAGEIIEHIYDTDLFLKEIYKALKPGGYLALSTPNIASLGRRISLLIGKSPLLETTLRPGFTAGHIRYFTFSTLKTLLEEDGFKVIKQESTCVNFDFHGKFRSLLFAKWFPSLGSSIVSYSQKI